MRGVRGESKTREPTVAPHRERRRTGSFLVSNRVCQRKEERKQREKGEGGGRINVAGYDNTYMKNYAGIGKGGHRPTGGPHRGGEREVLE